MIPSAGTLRVFLHNKYSLLHHNIVFVIIDKPLLAASDIKSERIKKHVHRYTVMLCL